MSHFHPIADAPAKSAGALGRADARLKLIAGLALIALVLLSRGYAFPSLVFAVSVFTALVIGVAPFTILLRFAEPLFIVLVLCAVKVFLTEHGSLREGMIIGSRVMGAVSVLALIGFTTTFTEVIAALGWMRLPRDFIEILTFAYRYIFVLFEEAVVIYTAQKNRLGYAKMSNGIRSFGTLAGALVLAVFDHAGQTSAALRQRGYEGVMPLYQHKHMRRTEAALAFMLILVSGMIWTVLRG